TVTSPSQPLPTLTTLMVSATSLSAGESVTLTANVHGLGSGGPLAVDGSSVLFMDNGVLFARPPVNVSTRTAGLTPTLNPGMHHIPGGYFGDANFAGSTSSAVPVTVAAPVFGDITSMVEITPISISADRVGPAKVITETLALKNVGQQPLQGRLFV